MTQLNTFFATRLLDIEFFNKGREYCDNELEVFAWKKERKPPK